MKHDKHTLVGTQFIHEDDTDLIYTITPYDTDSLTEEGILTIEWNDTDGTPKDTTYWIRTIIKNIDIGVWKIVKPKGHEVQQK